MAVAVNPNVIPLGTRLYVERPLLRKGTIIDVHFSTYEQFIQWGRRTVKVTILNQFIIVPFIFTEGIFYLIEGNVRK